MRREALPVPRALMLRPMAVADLDRVMAVEVQAYGHPWSRGNFTDSLAAQHVAELLVDERDELLGYFVALPGVDELHLLNLTVAPAHQRQGHARTLLDALEDCARSRGLARIWLEVRAGNARALELYRVRGFEPQGLRKGYYPAAASRREDAVVMALDLALAQARPEGHAGGAD